MFCSASSCIYQCQYVSSWFRRYRSFYTFYLFLQENNVHSLSCLFSFFLFVQSFKRDSKGTRKFKALLRLIVVTLQSALVHENILLISKYILTDIEPASWVQRSRSCLETHTHTHTRICPSHQLGANYRNIFLKLIIVCNKNSLTPRG